MYFYKPHLHFFFIFFFLTKIHLFTYFVVQNPAIYLFSRIFPETHTFIYIVLKKDTMMCTKQYFITFNKRKVIKGLSVRIFIFHTYFHFILASIFLHVILVHNIYLFGQNSDCNCHLGLSSNI